VTSRFAIVMTKITTKRSAAVAAVVRKFVFLFLRGLGIAALTGGAGLGSDT
jgi:hypothetical protein